MNCNLCRLPLGDFEVRHGITAHFHCVCEDPLGVAAYTKEKVMKLKDRYSPGTVVGELEGYPVQTYHAKCPSCTGVTFTTRRVADADQDAEIEVCQKCYTVRKVSVLR